MSGMRTIPEGEGLAFGRVKLKWKGDEKSFTTVLGEKPWSVVILPDDSSTAIDFQLGGDGVFFWHLPPGGYTVAGFQGVTPELFSSRVKGRVFAHFNVVRSAGMYIGMLTLSFDESGYPYQRTVEDEYELATRDLAARFPEIDINMNVRKELMVMERQR
jgi:hypothetical protein